MSEEPTVEQVMQMMSQAMGGNLPRALTLAAEVMPEMVLEQARSNGFAMPPDGALDAETRTLIYLAVALATGSQACIEANMNKARVLGISKEKILEVYKIARYAEATRVMGNAEKLFEMLK